MTATSPYLTGNAAPVSDEVTAEDLRVTGTIPEELEGRWLRNGPNPIGAVDPATHHWFMGNGMVHGVRLCGGRADWYRNRWVRGSVESEALGEAPVPGPAGAGPNTSVGGFAGRTWAMVEAGAPPMLLSYELDSLASDDLGGTLPNGFSAHPKYDPATGELHAACYTWPDLMDHVQYVVVGPDARVARVVAVPVPDMPMVHDMSLTESYALIYDLPVTVDIELALQERFPFRWNPDHPSRVGLLPRRAESADSIIWCDAPQQYVFHPVNAYDTVDGKVIVDVCSYDKLFDQELRGPFGDSLPTLDRWTIDPGTRVVKEQRIDDRGHEFPTHDPRVGTRRHRFGYTAGVATDSPTLHTATYKTDFDTGTVTERSHGPGRGAAEPLFIPRRGSTSEDGGWLMTVVYDAARDGSDLVILDAENFHGPEVARIELPRRVPHGFHGSWVPDTSVAP